MIRKQFLWVSSLSILLASPALSATLSPGLYVGPGDGATIALKVLPNHSAVLGAIITGNASVTPQSIQKSVTVHGGGFTGHLERKGSDYILTLAQFSFDKRPHPLCRYIMKPQDGGWHMSTITVVACSPYQGATWGFSEVGPQSVLKKVS